MTLEEIKERLKSTLKPQRYAHSLSVADTAVKLAEKYGADADKAYLAGILHDCAKNYSDAELFELLDKYNIEPDYVCRRSAALLHGFVGAEIARDIYGIDDAQIYDAIYYHTIGKADMPLLTEIIYLADGIEPLRNYPSADIIRAEAQKDLHRAVLMYTEANIKFVLEKGALLHPAAVETRNFYLEKTSL